MSLSTFCFVLAFALNGIGLFIILIDNAPKP
jgi:hypothetical protein